MNIKLDTLYKEKENKEALREVNIDLLNRAIAKAPKEQYQKTWFLNEIESYVEDIRELNDKIDEIVTLIEQQLKDKEM